MAKFDFEYIKSWLMKDIERLNENIKTSVWYCFLAMCLSSASVFGIYSLKSQLQAIQEMVVLYTSKAKCSVSSSSPSDLVPTSPKVSLSPFLPKRTMMFGDWQSNLHDHCQTEQGFQKETLGQDNNLSQHDPM